MTSLHKLLYADFNISVTEQHVAGLQRIMLGFETRGQHPQALGSPMLGVYKAHFLPQDELALFSLFGVTYSEFKRIAHQAEGINPAFNVVSDPYNILTVWLVHLFDVSKLAVSRSYVAKTCLIKLMQYRMFTSKVHASFIHGANEGIMAYTINNLTNKYHIKKYGSWKVLIEKRTEDILEGIHKDTFTNFYPDKSITNAISDIQTRLRKQIVEIANLYYDNHKKGNSVQSLSMVEEINGDTSIRVIESTLDTMIHGVSNSVTNLSDFIDHDFIKITVALSNGVSEELFIRLLTKFSGIAESQLKKGEQDLIKGTKSSPIYVGYHVLVSTIIQKTYRICIHDRVNMKSKMAILNKIRDIYRSSQISNPDILAIKDSVDFFVSKYGNSKRDATNASLRISLITYFVLLSFKYTG